MIMIVMMMMMILIMIMIMIMIMMTIVMLRTMRMTKMRIVVAAMTQRPKRSTMYIVAFRKRQRIRHEPRHGATKMQPSVSVCAWVVCFCWKVHVLKALPACASGHTHRRGSDVERQPGTRCNGTTPAQRAGGHRINLHCVHICSPMRWAAATGNELERAHAQN